MIKKQAGNGDNPNEREVLLAALQEITERLEDLETKKDSGAEARLLIAQRVYATERENLPEFTLLPLRSVRPYSLADMSARILDPDVQSGRVTLGQVRRESTYRHLRSVKGWLINKGAELATEQSRQADMEDSQQLELGR
jgi:hypothetical protein